MEDRASRNHAELSGRKYVRVAIGAETSVPGTWHDGTDSNMDDENQEKQIVGGFVMMCSTFFLCAARHVASATVISN